MCLVSRRCLVALKLGENDSQSRTGALRYHFPGISSRIECSNKALNREYRHSWGQSGLYGHIFGGVRDVPDRLDGDILWGTSSVNW